MTWRESEISVTAKHRGFNLITNRIVSSIPYITKYKIGVLHLFIKHTSASLTINENADYTVREDLETHFNKIVPDSSSYFTHTSEGPDDMSAHIKTSIIGNSINIPIKKGTLDLGTWQGIYLCEHRDIPRTRKISIIINGELY